MMQTGLSRSRSRRPLRYGRFRFPSFGNRAPLALLAASLALAAFAGGVWVGHFRAFPFYTVRSAWRTLDTLTTLPEAIPFFNPPPAAEWRWRPTALPLGRLDAHRIRRAEGAPADPILLVGGWEYFVEHCPGHAGCIAVEYAGRGEVRRAWPYRPEEIARATHPDDLPYELGFGFSFTEDATVFAAYPYPNGDLLVTFIFGNAFPYAGGVARLDRDGRPIWYRRDYSHHRPHLTADGAVLVPGMRVPAGPIDFGRRGRSGFPVRLRCQRPMLDVVRVIDGAGRVQEEISVFDAVLESRFARMIRKNASECDPLHLNSVDVLGEDAGGADGLAPGDLVVSLRGVDAFAVLDRRTHRVKRLVRGGFVEQHAVLHLEGSRFLMFDNLGMDAAAGGGFSRLLLVDVADGGETTIFPGAATPDPLREAFFSEIGGDVALSPDRRRVIGTAFMSGRGVEVRLSDGAVLAEFDNAHDVSRLEWLPDDRMTRARRRPLPGVRYVPGER